MSLLEKEVLEALKKGVIVWWQYRDPFFLGCCQGSQASLFVSPPSSPRLSPVTEELFVLFFRLMNEHHTFSDEKLLDLFHRVVQEDFSSLERLSHGTVSQAPSFIIPASVFLTHLSPSEALCTFLKDEQKLSFHEIAQELNRDDRSIWTSYHRATQKARSTLPVRTSSSPLIPLALFKDRTFSILEHVVGHLKSQRMKNKEIAQLLNKSPAVVATVLLRVKKKQKQEQKQDTTHG